MKYLKCDWRQNSPSYPTLIYVEVDQDNFELRKLEFFLDGNIGYATQKKNYGKTELSSIKTPDIEEINSYEGLTVLEITKEEFERVWSNNVDVK